MRERRQQVKPSLASHLAMQGRKDIGNLGRRNGVERRLCFEMQES